MTLSKKVAKLYNKRFSGKEKKLLWENRVIPLIANHYPREWSAGKIAFMHYSQAYPGELMKQYIEIDRLAAEFLFEGGIMPWISNHYHARFKPFHKKQLFWETIPPELANTYPRKFSVEEIIKFVDHNIPPEFAKYHKQLTCIQIIKKASQTDRVKQELRDKNDTENAELLKEKVTFIDQLAGSSLKVLNYLWELKDRAMGKPSVTYWENPKKTSKHTFEPGEDPLNPKPSRMPETLIINKERKPFIWPPKPKPKPKKEKAFFPDPIVVNYVAPKPLPVNTEWSPLVKLIMEGPDNLPGEFTENQKKYVEEKGYSLGEISLFKRKTFQDIVSFLTANIGYKIANEYNHKKFSGEDIAFLIQNGIAAKRANKNKRMKVEEIVSKYVGRGTGDKQKQREMLLRRIKNVIMEDIADQEASENRKKLEEPIIEFLKVYTPDTELDFLGTGKYSIVIQRAGYAWKFTTKAEYEHNLLSKVHTYWKGNQKNIVGLGRAPPMKQMIEIECIQGESLEKKIRRKGKISVMKVMKYGKDILNGMIEARMAGIIHHRDISPKNIMIDRIKKRAVIIDLGISTTDRWPEQNYDYNKTFGPNDLVALAQTLYMAAAGELLFTESGTMSLTRVKIPMKDEREQIYAPLGIATNHEERIEAYEKVKQNLKTYYQKIDQKIPKKGKGKVLRGLIKELLTAKPYEYRIMQRRFIDAMK